MKVTILGTKYKVITDEYLDNADGLCDKTTKEIKVCKSLYEEPKAGQVKDMVKHANKVMRHEVIHAFQNESGLLECANWDTEQMVDYFAYQIPKMNKVFEKLGVLND